MFDYLCLLRSGTISGALTTTGTTAGVEINESPARGLSFEAVVPAAAATTTLDIEIQCADTDADASYATVGKFLQITAAGLYACHVAIAKKYVRQKSSVAGTTPNFGAVTIGIVPGDVRNWNV